ncbi:MAG TPA: ferredoxin family protein [Thermoleophilia bacterium]|nr:ferredoxin family protein [Thermoleophilia bacterium]
MTDAGTEAKSTKRRAPEAILVDFDLCKCCGICSELCPQDVFDVDDLGHPVVARLDDCTTCGFCERHCPDFAVAIRRPARAEAAAARPKSDDDRAAGGPEGED